MTSADHTDDTDDTDTTCTTDGEVQPFQIAVPDTDLADLRERLARTRFPEAATTDGWSQGPPVEDMRGLLASWAAHDWRASEERLNRLPHFRTELDGLAVHFVHVVSRHDHALPLLLTHGWPGSFLEFEQALGPLTDPTAHGGTTGDAFHVVVPSLPGFGFSERPEGPGWGVARTARAWRQLMSRLGYPRYGAQGGDWGMLITTAMAEQAQAGEGLDAGPGPIGIHLSPPPVGPTPQTADDRTETERAALEAMAHYAAEGLGYAEIQRTRPQTIGYALVDSPAALAAWVVDKLHAWSDHNGDLTGAVGRAEVLDLLSLYWFTRTGASAARLYWESFPAPDEMRGDGGSPAAVHTPTGGMIMPADHGRPSRRWAEARFPDLRHWAELERGGHFPAWEVPADYVAQVRASFATVR